MISHFNIHSIELVLLILMAAMVIIAGIARRLSLSYPIILVIAGLLSGLLPGVPKIYLLPDLVFFVFLPPLLFAASWQTSWRDFRYNLVSIGFLAVGLVFFTAFGVAYTAHYFLPAFDWRAGFLLGAVVSTTDAVAATSIAKRIGLPRRILDILEGESLVNDATGLLALEFGIDMMVRGTTPSLGAASLHFIWLLGGGILTGLVIGGIASWLETWVDDGPVEVAISIMVGYGTYLAGESIGASGVIAVVTCGLYMSRKSSTYFAPAARLQTMAVWDALEFLLNGLVFLLIGMQVPYVLSEIKGYSRVELLTYGLGFSALLIALRLLWIYPGAFLAYKIRHGLLHQDYKMPGPRMLFLVGWTGMRGVVALAAASTLPYTLANGASFPQRNLIVFLTFVVILVTLVLQGLSLPPLVRRLGLSEDRRPRCERIEARLILAQRVIAFLEEERRLATGSEAFRHAYDDALHHYEHRLESLNGQHASDGQEEHEHETSAMQKILLKAVRTEREQLIQMRNTDQIDDETYRILERELDLSESNLLLSLHG